MAPAEVIFLTSNSIKLSGHLYIPDSYKAKERLPAIVVAHPGGGVKEQTAGTYANHLAAHGFITLAFDRATQGASEGTPRYVEDPFQAGEDVKAAVTYLSIDDKVDPKRVGAFGICAGGGYVIYAASTDRRIKALATVSMIDIAALFSGIPKDQLDALQTAAGEARNQYAITGEVPYLPIVPTPDQLPADAPTLMREGSDYYCTSRGCHERSINKMATWSYEWFTVFEPFRKIQQISPRPLLLVAGEIADTLAHSKEAYEKAAQPKGLIEIKGATHVDLYDKKVDEVVPKLVEFFKRNL